jgi:hypothetical protein
MVMGESGDTILDQLNAIDAIDAIDPVSDWRLGGGYGW